MIRLFMGYIPTRVIYVAAKLDLTDHIGDDGASAQDLAQKLELDPAALYRVLRVLVMDQQAPLSDLWTATGFADVETTSLVIPMEFSSFDDFWQHLSDSQGPPKPYISSLSENRRKLLKERLRTDILVNRPDGSIMLRAKAWAVRGVVPAR